MKAFKILLVLLAIAAAGLLGWRAGRQTHVHAPATNGRKVLYYQSAMHPHIKSDKPGNCTICGMALTPIYDGETGFQDDTSRVVLAEGGARVLNVATVKVGEREIARTLRLPGVFVPDPTRVRRLSAYVDGRVDKLSINFVGAEVEAGQPLAVVYSPTLLSAERDYASLAALPSAPERKAMLEAAAGRLSLLGLTQAQIEALPSKPAGTPGTEVLAPISGTVVKRMVFEGQYVREGEVLFEIADLSSLWLQASVFEQDLGWIRVGDEAEIVTPADQGAARKGVVAFIEPEVDPATRAALVRIAVENPLGERGRELLGNQYAEARVIHRTEEVLAVPRGAVLHTGGRARVFVDDGLGGYQRREVGLGRSGDGWVEILDGLKEGEMVVSQGNLMIDAQAELNRALTPGGGGHAPQPGGSAAAPPETPALTVGADAALLLPALFDAVADVAAALAADDLAATHSAAEKLSANWAAAIASPAGGGDLDGLLPAPPSHGGLADLAAARLAFRPYLQRVVAVAGVHRARGGAFPYTLQRCPMFPSRSESSVWLQRPGPRANPYFGAEMLGCGTEIADTQPAR